MSYQPPAWPVVQPWAPAQTTQVVQNIEPPREYVSPDPADGKVKKLSASSVDLFRTCARKWAFKFLEGFSDFGKATALGTRVHTILEAYQEHGTDPDLSESMVIGHKYKVNPDGSPELTTYWPGQIAQSGIHLLPPPGVVQVEGAFKCKTPASEWTGRKDGRYVRGADGVARPITEFRPGSLVIVQDHKTTSDPKWALTEETEPPEEGAEDHRLSTNVQAILYAYAEMVEWDIDWVGAEWIYYLTAGKKRDAWAVRHLFSRPTVMEQIRGIDETAAQIHAVYQIRPKALELPPNPKACKKYGGCPHENRCDLSVTERIFGLMANEDIKALMERKRQERAALANGSVPPIVPPNPPAMAVVPPAATPAVVPVLQNLQPSQPPMGSGFPAGWAPDPQGDPSVWLNVATGSRVIYATGQPAPAPTPPPAQEGPPPLPPEVQAAMAAQTTQAPPPALHWRPGMPLNAAQEYLRHNGKPWSVVAMAADGNVPSDVAATYDSTYDAAGNYLAHAPVERTHINPPEAPATAPSHPGEMPTPPTPKVEEKAPPDDLDGLDRDRLKAMAVAMGVQDSSSRLREEGLRKVIREARAKGGFGQPMMASQAVNAPSSQPAAAPPVQPQPTPSSIPTSPLTQAVQAATQPQTQTGAPNVNQTQSGAEEEGGFILFIQCAPLTPGERAQFTLEDILQELLPKLRAETGLADYRLEGVAGPGRLAAALESFLQEAAMGPDTDIIMDATTDEGRACLGVLTRYSSQVIRGF